MRPRDVLDYMRLRKLVENPGAYWTARRRPAGEDVLLRFRAGHEFALRPGTHDAHRFHRIFLKDEYRTAALGNGMLDCVVDVGANTGLFSVLMAPRARRVYGFEPEERNFRYLERHIDYPLFRHVHVRRAAVTGGARTLRLRLSENMGGHSGYMGGDGEAVDVAGVPLDAFFQEADIPHCDLLKLDCEGAEYEILFSLSSENLGRIRRIVMEYHPIPQAPDPRWTVQGLSDFLRAGGFRLEAEPSRRLAGYGWIFAERA